MTESDDRALPDASLLPTREDRAREREEARERRSTDRAAAAQARADRRAAEREAASREREARRASRQPGTPSSRAAQSDTGAEEARPPQPAPKRRASGALRRTGEARIERETRQFRTIVDARRIRELARRGATIEGLATVFKISLEEVRVVLAESD